MSSAWHWPRPRRPRLRASAAGPALASQANRRPPWTRPCRRCPVPGPGHVRRGRRSATGAGGSPPLTAMSSAWHWKWRNAPCGRVAETPFPPNQAIRRPGGRGRASGVRCQAPDTSDQADVRPRGRASPVSDGRCPVPGTGRGGCGLVPAASRDPVRAQPRDCRPPGTRAHRPCPRARHWTRRKRPPRPTPGSPSARDG
jgi:hypothetical protein